MDRDAYDLTIIGKQSIDDDSNQTGQILAALMDAPQATFAYEIDLGDGKATVTREIDQGLQKIEVDLPAVFTCDLRLNKPRFSKIQDIIKAKKKKVETIELADLGIDFEPRLQTISVSEPPKRKGGVTVETVDELLDKLRNEAKVI